MTKVEMQWKKILLENVKIFCHLRGQIQWKPTLFNDLSRDSRANNFIIDVYCRCLWYLQTAFFPVCNWISFAISSFFIKEEMGSSPGELFNTLREHSSFGSGWIWSVPCWSVFDFWKINLDELDFLSISNCVAC